MKKVLLIEDDSSIQQLLMFTLKHSGFETILADGIQSGKKQLSNSLPDFAVIDIGLSDGLGYEIVPELIKNKIPFIFLTARGHLTEKLYGIELGADDYIVKPFEPLELVARIKMILRRTVTNECPNRRFEALLISLNSRTVSINNSPVNLSPKEFDLLAFLSSTPGQIYSRDQLLDHVWGYNACGSPRTVDTHIQTLRQKIGSQHIRTVYKVGYAFEGDLS